MNKTFQFSIITAVFVIMISTVIANPEWEKIRLSNKEKFDTKCKYRATLSLNGRKQIIYFTGIQPEKLYYCFGYSNEDAYVDHINKKEYTYTNKDKTSETISLLEYQCDNQRPEEDVVNIVRERQGMGKILKIRNDYDWSESE